jgi:hypothetical protein
MTAVNLVAITAATLILYKQSPRDAVILQGELQHQELVKLNARMEELLAAALSREALGQSQASTSTTQSRVPDAVDSATAGRLTLEQAAVHDELIQAGNALVDRTIATGAVALSDFAEVAAATRGLSSEERVKILARLSAAINENRVGLGGPSRVP